MNRRTNRRLDMAIRALEFSRAHPVDSAGYASALKQLEEQITRANQLAEEQQHGLAEVRSATARKNVLKRTIRRSHLRHFASVARKASSGQPELAGQFDLPRLPFRGLAFRAAARAMVEAAEQQKELLVKHGLVEEVLENAHQSLDEYDQLVERGAEGRRVHIGASASLEVVTDGAIQNVKILDGLNRYRFATQPDLLAAWTAASNIIGPPPSGARVDDGTGSNRTPTAKPVQDDQVKPAA